MQNWNNRTMAIYKDDLRLFESCAKGAAYYIEKLKSAPCELVDWQCHRCQKTFKVVPASLYCRKWCFDCRKIVTSEQKRNAKRKE